MAQTNNFLQKYVTVGGPLTDSLVSDDGTRVLLLDDTVTVATEPSSDAFGGLVFDKPDEEELVSAGVIWSIEGERKWATAMDLENKDLVLACSLDSAFFSPPADLFRVSQNGRFTMGDGIGSPQEDSNILTIRASNRSGGDAPAPPYNPLALAHSSNNRYGLTITAAYSGTGTNSSASILLNGKASSDRTGHIEMFSGDFSGFANEFWIYSAGNDAPLVLGTLGSKRVQVGVDGSVWIKNRVSAPTENASGGGYLYVESGALKFRGGGNPATVTTLAPA